MIGGWGKAGIVFDMDGSFDIARFNQLLLGHLNPLVSFDKHVAQTVARESLHRLHIFRPSSSTQLATTITQLGRYHGTHLPSSEMGLVAVDSLNAYYWPERFVVEHMRVRGNGSFRPPVLHVLTALASLRETHGPAIVLTRRDVQSSSSHEDAHDHAAPLIPTRHIRLSGPDVPRVQSGKAHEKKEQSENAEIIQKL